MWKINGICGKHTCVYVCTYKVYNCNGRHGVVSNTNPKIQIVNGSTDNNGCMCMHEYQYIIVKSC